MKNNLSIMINNEQLEARSSGRFIFNKQNIFKYFSSVFVKVFNDCYLTSPKIKKTMGKCNWNLNRYQRYIYSMINKVYF